MDPFQAYVAFARSYEAGSFSAVARELGSSQSAVSKQIAALEKSLGVQLFARTTRRLSPTNEGMRLYEHVRQMLDAADALRAATGQAAEPAGVLRMTLPSAYGRRRITPLLPTYLERHPLVRLDVHLSDQISDLVEDGFELGIRIGTLAPSSLMARPVGILEHMVVATPRYLTSHRQPEVPTDLAEHNCILYANEGRWSRWAFESETGRHVVDVEGPVRVNDSEAMCEMVRAHMGLAMLPTWVAEEPVRKGELLNLLPDYYPIPVPVNAVYPQTRFLSMRARTFIDFLVDALGTKAPPA